MYIKWWNFKIFWAKYKHKLWHLTAPYFVNLSALFSCKHVLDQCYHRPAPWENKAKKWWFFLYLIFNIKTFKTSSLKRVVWLKGKKVATFSLNNIFLCSATTNNLKSDTFIWLEDWLVFKWMKLLLRKEWCIWNTV